MSTARTFSIGSVGASGFALIIKSANQTRSATTVLADDSELVLNLDASSLYIIRTVFNYEIANATMDFKYRFNYTGTVTEEYSRRSRFGAGDAGGFDSESVVAGTAQLNTDFPLALTTFGVGRIEMETLVRTNAAGVYSVQWAQNTSDAGNVTLHQGSHIAYRKA